MIKRVTIFITIALLSLMGMTKLIFGASDFGVVVDFSGTVIYKSAQKKEWTKVSYFTTLPEGASIKTGSNSTVVIQKKDGTLLRVYQNAVIELKKGKGTKDAAMTKTIKVPDKIKKAFQEKLDAIRNQLTIRSGTFEAYSTPSGKATTPYSAPPQEPLVLFYAPLFMSEKSFVSLKSARFSWDGLEEESPYTVTIYSTGDERKTLYSGTTKSSTWILPESHKLLEAGKKYTIEVKARELAVSQNFEVLPEQDQAGMSEDLKTIEIKGKPQELAPLDLIILGTLYEKYGMLNDALGAYKILREKNQDMAEACITGLKKR